MKRESSVTSNKSRMRDQKEREKLLYIFQLILLSRTFDWMSGSNFLCTTSEFSHVCKVRLDCEMISGWKSNDSLFSVLSRVTDSDAHRRWWKHAQYSLCLPFPRVLSIISEIDFHFRPHIALHHTESTESCERGAIKGKNRETIESKPSTHPFSQLVENVYTSRLNGPLFKHKSFNSISFSMVIWYCWYRSGRSSQDKLLPCIFFFLFLSNPPHDTRKLSEWGSTHTAWSQQQRDDDKNGTMGRSQNEIS